ncbi:MAG: hypothetical protein CVU55_01225 [Deltaproteobacteria bacterium HGW-Deltaproteobacteria-13]|nr:MAG: hypothetical protein CVU55_01225 [Deltaproteobacteria bacterium HGW-Deltaproteobacteria-13]
MGVTCELELINSEYLKNALNIIPKQISGRTLSEIQHIFPDFSKDFSEFCKYYGVKPDLSTDMFSMNGLFCYLIRIESLELDKSLSHGFSKLFTSVNELSPLKNWLLDFKNIDVDIPKELMDEDGGLFGIWNSHSLKNVFEILSKYYDPNILITNIENSNVNIIGKLIGTKKKQLDALNIFNDKYYLDIWRELKIFLEKAIKDSRLIGISIFP